MICMYMYVVYILNNIGHYLCMQCVNMYICVFIFQLQKFLNIKFLLRFGKLGVLKAREKIVSTFLSLLCSKNVPLL